MKSRAAKDTVKFYGLLNRLSVTRSGCIFIRARGASWSPKEAARERSDRLNKELGKGPYAGPLGSNPR
jgi:hypothetical protein